MMKVEIRPDWFLRDAAGRPTALPALLGLLAAVSESGSISKAATQRRISYRHAWGLLTQFSTQFGAELVVKVRGQGTVLSPLAEKLIWADRRIAARLTPLLDSLASELQQELASVLALDVQVLRLTASHGFAVAALVAQLEAQGVTVDIKYRGSTEAVAALARGECELAGFHLPVGEFEHAAAAKYRAWLDPARHALIHLAYRTQGIFVAKGNPKHVTGLADLVRPDLRFVNRQQGSGTRVLLELLLARAGIDHARISGNSVAEFTHAAVAAYVASGMADVSFGVETAARRFDLDFIPIIREQYFLACDKKLLDAPLVTKAQDVMASTAFKAVLAALPGYEAERSGTRLDVHALFQTSAHQNV
ncbi:substrate-binding domain-containing protein [Massilia aurea]|uniref:substrate-binding domain-containing protein n=1 Tax=Massilia aurea TaxID=373040 RepID=UPI003462DB44